VSAQIELTEQQYDSIPHSSFEQEALLTFHASLTVSQFSDLLKLARNLANVFGGTYTCEIKQIEVLFKNHRCALT
jgi:hypothetical protein